MSQVLEASHSSSSRKEFRKKYELRIYFKMTVWFRDLGPEHASILKSMSFYEESQNGSPQSSLYGVFLKLRVPSWYLSGAPAVSKDDCFFLAGLDRGPPVHAATFHIVPVPSCLRSVP